MRALLYFFILALVLFSSCKQTTETFYAKEQAITESVYASGIIKSVDQYQVFPKVSSTIAGVLVKEGDLVSKGQIILTLDKSTAVINANNAAAAAKYNTQKNNLDKLEDLKNTIAFAKQKVSNDSLLYQRQKNLWQQNIGTKIELEQRQLAFENSKLAYQSALIKLNQQKKAIAFAEEQSALNAAASNSLLSDFDVRSEMDGIVFDVLKKPGEMVSPQIPVAIIGAKNQFLIELQVDEFDIAKVKGGQKIIVSLDSYKGQTFEATVNRIIPLLNEKTKSFTVEATFQQVPPALYPNLTVEANIVIQHKSKALLIPRALLLNDQEVVLANGEKRKVVTGLKDYEQVEIISGIGLQDALIKPR